MADQTIIEEIKQAIENIRYGSVEVIVQDGTVTQISTRIIKKTNIKNLNHSSNGVANSKKKIQTGLSINLKY